jgi:hypothetical protein
MIYRELDIIRSRIATDTHGRGIAAEQRSGRIVIVSAPSASRAVGAFGMWFLVIVAVLLVAEFARTELREWAARRRAVKRGRTLTAKYGIPWR